MPVGKVFDASQNQVLFNPVSNFYKGKAIRAGLAAQEQDAELKGLQIEAAKDELANAPAERLAAQRKAAADYALTVESIRKRRLEVGDLEMDAYRDAVGPWTKEYGKLNREDPDAAIAWANDNFESVLARLPEDKRSEFMAAAGPDHKFNHEELDRVGLSVMAYEADKDPTGHQQVLDDLVARDFITEEQRNQALLDIEKKAGTIVGRTPEDAAADPRTPSQLGSDYQINLDSYNTSTDVQEMISDALPQVSEAPGTVGIRGAIGQGGAGILSSLGQDEMSDAFAQYMSGASPEEIAQIQTQLQSIRGRIIPIVTGERGKRLSETEREIASKAVGVIDSIKGPADLTKSYPLVVGAMRQLYAESWATQFRLAQRDKNIDYPYNLANDNEVIELLTEFSEAGVDANTAKRTIIRLQSIQGVE